MLPTETIFSDVYRVRGETHKKGKKKKKKKKKKKRGKQIRKRNEERESKREKRKEKMQKKQQRNEVKREQTIKESTTAQIVIGTEQRMFIYTTSSSILLLQTDSALEYD